MASIEEKKKEEIARVGPVLTSKNVTALPLSGEGSGGQKLFTREKWKIA